MVDVDDAHGIEIGAPDCVTTIVEGAAIMTAVMRLSTPGGRESVVQSRASVSRFF